MLFDQPAIVFSEADRADIVFVSSVLQGVAAGLQVVRWHKEGRDLRRQRSGSPLKRLPFVTKVLVASAMLTALVGLWLIFHPSVLPFPNPQPPLSLGPDSIIAKPPKGLRKQTYKVATSRNTTPVAPRNETQNSVAQGKGGNQQTALPVPSDAVGGSKPATDSGTKIADNGAQQEQRFTLERQDSRQLAAGDYELAVIFKADAEVKSDAEYSVLFNATVDKAYIQTSVGNSTFNRHFESNGHGKFHNKIIFTMLWPRTIPPLGELIITVHAKTPINLVRGVEISK